MSELLDHYLDTVAASLPRGQRQDIVAELRDLLLTKFEDEEAALGRPLTRPEQEALLARFGHPLEVAGRYGRTRHLIGPAVYPFYVHGLKVTLCIVAAINLVAWVIAWAVTGHADLPLLRLAPALLITFAAVTITAALIERFGQADRYLRPWKPGPLPRRGKRPGRPVCDLFLEAAFGAVALYWWVAMSQGFIGGREVSLRLAPVWRDLYWPILVLIGVQIALDLFALAAPARYRLHAGLRIAWHLAMAPVLLWLARAGAWFDVTIQGHPLEAAALQSHIDQWMPIGLAVTLLIMLIEVGRDVWRLVAPGTRVSHKP
ncbi:MAG: hypothetical protein JWM33_1882 [Caulobacteraceae bacterium]|nr:hypothetical protein [Caulobacteraceae bacterium]